jgi:hypothetical protein
MKARGKHGTGGPVKRKSKPPQDDKAQSKRFVEDAKRFGVDESASSLFEKAIKSILPKRPTKEK